MCEDQELTISQLAVIFVLPVIGETRHPPHVSITALWEEFIRYTECNTQYMLATIYIFLVFITSSNF